MPELRRVPADGESCIVCGDTPDVLTDARQRGDGGWWCSDGDAVECPSCGAVGGISHDDGEAWVNWIEDHPATVRAYEAEEATP